jgi:hypothetical protein
MFGPHALLPRSARLVSRITATKFIPRLTARWDALSSTRWRAMQLRRLIYLRLRRYFRHRSEPDRHLQEKPIHHCHSRLGGTRCPQRVGKKPLRLRRPIILRLRRCHLPPAAFIWSARRGETIPLKTRNSRVASRVPGYFF